MGTDWVVFRQGDIMVVLRAELCLWYLLGIATVILGTWAGKMVSKLRGTDVVRVSFPRSITVEHWGRQLTVKREWHPTEGWGYPCPVCKLPCTPQGLGFHLRDDHKNEGRFTSEEGAPSTSA